MLFFCKMIDISAIKEYNTRIRCYILRPRERIYSYPNFFNKFIKEKHQ